MTSTEQQLITGGDVTTCDSGPTKAAIQQTELAYLVVKAYRCDNDRYCGLAIDHPTWPTPNYDNIPDSWSKQGFLFPPSRGINVNMMPFLLFDPRSTLPDELQSYADIIKTISMLIPRVGSTDSHIAYLTVHESDVAANQTQRRPGLHIESSLARDNSRMCLKDPSCSAWDDENRVWNSVAWGIGHVICIGPPGNGVAVPIDGIYIASSVSDSCIVYPALVEAPEQVTDVHGQLPDDARPLLGKGRLLKAGELCWITDRTPHESLPLQRDTHRQFFRLIVGRIEKWYTMHNTPNPLGIMPDASVQIVREDKFALPSASSID